MFCAVVLIFLCPFPDFGPITDVCTGILLRGCSPPKGGREGTPEDPSEGPRRAAGGALPAEGRTPLRGRRGVVYRYMRECTRENILQPPHNFTQTHVLGINYLRLLLESQYNY